MSNQSESDWRSSSNVPSDKEEEDDCPGERRRRSPNPASTEKWNGGMSPWDFEDEELAQVEAEIIAQKYHRREQPQSRDSSPDPLNTTNSGYKIIFRRLPPILSEQEFVDIIEIERSEYNYLCLKNPDCYTKTRSDDDPRSVAFVNFINPLLAQSYLAKFDGFKFQDRYGREYVGTTSEAPCQLIPKVSYSVDPLEGTTEGTEEFHQYRRGFEIDGNISGVPPKYIDGAKMSEAVLQEIADRELHPVWSLSCPLLDYCKDKLSLENQKSTTKPKKKIAVKVSRKKKNKNEREGRRQSEVLNKPKKSEESKMKKKNVKKETMFYFQEESFPGLCSSVESLKLGLK